MTGMNSLFAADPRKEEVSNLSEIKLLILDVLKPHNPSIVEVSRTVSDLEGVSGVNCMLEEVDKETDSLKITITPKDEQEGILVEDFLTVLKSTLGVFEK